jgi:predicted nucleotidyltransferase
MAPRKRPADLPPTVALLLDDLIPAIRDALPYNFCGAYLTGSLALGCFDPETSDVDVLVVTKQPITDEELERLNALHERIPLQSDGTRPEYEVYYIDRETIRRFEPGQRHVKAEPGYGLFRTEHRPSWVIERWTVREYGVKLAGPDPKQLIEPVTEHELREAATGELQQRLTNWEEGIWPLSDLGHRGSQGFEIETACRVLLTVESGAVSSKQDALTWARERLPEEWHPLLDLAELYRKDRTQDASCVDQVLSFVRWAVGRASMSEA